MECQIERRTNELNLVIESAYDAYISIDAHDVILDWNRAAEVMFGWPRKALARTITELIFPTGLPPSNNRAAIISTARRRDDTELPVEIRIKALMIDGRERRSLLSTILPSVSSLSDCAINRRVKTCLPSYLTDGLWMSAYLKQWLALDVPSNP